MNLRYTGHIDYVVRYGPEKNKNYSYDKYKDVIDEILRQLIAHGKGIELNMAGFKYGLGHPNPTEEILHRYRELGGEIITIGADGHAPDQIAWDFDKVPQLLKAAGFDYFTVFTKRETGISSGLKSSRTHVRFGRFNTQIIFLSPSIFLRIVLTPQRYRPILPVYSGYPG